MMMTYEAMPQSLHMLSFPNANSRPRSRSAMEVPVAWNNDQFDDYSSYDAMMLSDIDDIINLEYPYTVLFSDIHDQLIGLDETRGQMYDIFSHEHLHPLFAPSPNSISPDSISSDSITCSESQSNLEDMALMSQLTFDDLSPEDCCPPSYFNMGPRTLSTSSENMEHRNHEINWQPSPSASSSSDEDSRPSSTSSTLDLRPLVVEEIETAQTEPTSRALQYSSKPSSLTSSAPTTTFSKLSSRSTDRSKEPVSSKAIPRKHTKRRRKSKQLWQFLLETLADPTYNPHYIQWEDREGGVFRFVESQKVAQLWGEKKRKSNMNYEYLSRAIRHYYARDVMQRVSRLVYKFGKNADGWKTYAACR